MAAVVEETAKPLGATNKKTQISRNEPKKWFRINKTLFWIVRTSYNLLKANALLSVTQTGQIAMC